MARILALHGAVLDADPQRFAFQNLTDAEVLRTFLSSAPPFVPLSDALAGRGDALTIDDATRAAADAAMIAREYGHAVSVFINPEQVESGEPYWFVFLYMLIDGLGPGSYVFENRTYPTSTRAERWALRQQIKARCRGLRDESARVRLIVELAKRWGLGRIEAPGYFATLPKSDLAALRDAGVDLQNHGWSHSDHADLSDEESAREITEGRDWLRREVGVDAPYFAVPFGDVLPNPEVASTCTLWLTLYDQWPEGLIGSNAFNRVEPNLAARVGCSEPVQATGLPFREWISRIAGLSRR